MPATDEKSVKHGGMPGQGETVDPRWPLSGCLAKKRKSKKLAMVRIHSAPPTSPQFAWVQTDACVAVPKGFRALNAAQRRGLRPVLEGREAQPGTRYVLTLAGRSLQNQPLEERRKQLQAKVMPRTPESMVFSETLEAAPSEVTEAVRAQGLEGVVAKRRNSLYEPRRRIRDRTRKASVSSFLSQVPVQGSA
jgi:hypothetical protein